MDNNVEVTEAKTARKPRGPTVIRVNVLNTETNRLYQVPNSAYLRALQAGKVDELMAETMATDTGKEVHTFTPKASPKASKR